MSQNKETVMHIMVLWIMGPLEIMFSKNVQNGIEK